MERYDFVFSLGAACSCSSCLRNANLQFASYPFDWLYGSNIKDRAALLCHGFEGWLDKDALVCVGKREHPLPCDIYRNTKTGIVFNHDFPLGEDFDKAYIEVNEKYDRRIQRLIEGINSAKRVLAVYITSPDDNNTDSQILIDTKELLDNTFGKDKIDLLFMYSEPGLSIDDAEIVVPQKGIKAISFDYSCKDEKAESYAVDLETIRDWLMKNYSTKDKRGVWQKIRYYYNRKKKYMNDFGDSFWEQIINNIQYKIWKHLNKKLLKKGIIRK